MTFLETITAKKRAEVAQLAGSSTSTALAERACALRQNRSRHVLKTALYDANRVKIIAEIKRASPSRGVIRDEIDVASLARAYETGGAAGISALTEPEYFHGSLEDLRMVRAAASIPLLRKDFIVDASQVYEAAAAGADAVLLIVAALDPTELADLIRIIEGELAMDALVEAHTKQEVHTAATAGATLIGVNNRDLHSLEVSLDVSRTLIKEKPPGTVMIAESGISTRDEILELRELGYEGFLLGESLMRSEDPAAMLRNLIL